MRFLYRAILSHVLVAAPPAAALGYLVLDINRKALETEVQSVHMAVSGELSRRLTREVEASTERLRQAERILDTTELKIEDRQLLLKAMVAEGGLPCLALFDNTGARDTVMGTCPSDPPARLDGAVLEELKNAPYAILDARVEGEAARVAAVVPWVRGSETLGYLAAPLALETLEAPIQELGERHLGKEGEIDIVDGSGRYLLSSIKGRVGQSAPAASPFGLIAGKKREGASSVGVGVALRFDAPDGTRLGVMTSAPELRWILGVSRPEAIAFASLDEVRRRTAALALFAALLGATLALALARGVVAPIDALSQAVRKVAKGGFRQKLAPPKDPDLGKLVAAFNEMTTELEVKRKEASEKTQLRLKLARYLPPDALHQILSAELSQRVSSRESAVSVIYAEIERVGPEAAALRPEQLVQVLGQFFTAAVASIQRHGGRVDPYSGDAVIAVFDSTEVSNHAEAAIRAALDVLQDGRIVSERFAAKTDRKSAFAVSAGVRTGRGEIALTENGDVSVTGAIVEDALELQRQAGPGIALLDKDTASACPEAVRFVQRPDGRVEISI